MESVCRTAGSGPGGGSARPNNPSARSSRLFSESVCFLSLLSGSPSTGSRFQGAELEGGPGRVGTGPPHLPLPAGFPTLSPPPLQSLPRLHLDPTQAPFPLGASLFRFLLSLETLQVGSRPTALLAGTGALLLPTLRPGMDQSSRGWCVWQVLKPVWGMPSPGCGASGLPTPGALALTGHKWDNLKQRF